jgi:tetraprenyl-beta-curcumene synthase
MASALGSYRLTVIPPLRREQRRWREVAGAIPDPVLRRQALAALEGKASNVEAIGVFATLAPRAHRRQAIRAMTTLQIAVDYLDTLSEGVAENPLEDGLRLHRALTVALTPGAEPEDWYRDHPRREDGGYLSGLVAACQEQVRGLPSHATVLPLARQAAQRCGEGQSHTHAAAGGGPSAGADDEVESLESWARGQDTAPGYRWWEVAAGASSSVAAHALIATAAEPGATAEQAQLIDAAYFPPVGALTVLLDDLIDLEDDRATGEHNYMTYYSSAAEAAEQLALITARGAAAVAELPRRRRHEAILAGVAAFYLSAPEASTAFARPIRDRLVDALGPEARPLVAVMRLRRR